MAEEEKGKKQKKLGKEIIGTVVQISEKLTGENMSFDFLDLPKEIQEKFGPFGLGHKLGDAAAGKEGAEAVEAIKKVWDGLKAGDWAVRAPAGEKVSLKAVWDKVQALPSEKERKAAITSLKAIGLDLSQFEAQLNK